nr:hypothetical protein [Tanacetum cinerariifolium]
MNLSIIVSIIPWEDTEVPISEGSHDTITESQMETYKIVSQDIRDQLNAEAEAVQIILTRINNDIYSIVNACPNACEMWKAIERLKQGESINVQDLETNLYWEFGKFTSHDGKSLESYYSRSTGYENQRIGNVARARETIGSTVVQKYRIQCYKSKEFRHVARECQKPKRVKDVAYHREKMLLCKQEEARIQLNAEQADWRDDTDDELEDQELEVHYMYMAQLQEVSNDDHYSMFAIESEHPEQSESVHDTYPIEQDAHNVIIDSLDMSYNREEIDQNDDDNDLANEPSESDDVIRLEKESRSKLSDLIKPFDYDKLNNLYDLFAPQREKSSEQRYFSERSRLSHTPVNNGK